MYIRYYLTIMFLNAVESCNTEVTFGLNSLGGEIFIKNANFALYMDE